MAYSRRTDPTLAHRHRFIVEDPARFGCLCAAATLLFMPEVPFSLTLLVVLVTQLAPILMISRAMSEGWSRRWGRSVHPSVFASSLAMDFTHLSACTLVGALLLTRHFNGAEILRPLCILAVAVCFLPDVRVCRFLLAGDPATASRQLREGLCLRDPVMLGALLTTAVVCFLDRASLNFVFLSLCFLQFNTVLVMLDKYLPEIEVLRLKGWAGLFLEREGRRFWLCLAPLALIPVRLSLGDRAALYGAAGIASAILLPDLFRGLMVLGRNVMNMFRVTPIPSPATIIVLPKAN